MSVDASRDRSGDIVLVRRWRAGGANACIDGDNAAAARDAGRKKRRRLVDDLMGFRSQYQ